MGVRVDFREAPVVQTVSAAGGCGGSGWVFRDFAGSRLKTSVFPNFRCIWLCPMSRLLSPLLWAKGATAQREPFENHPPRLV